MGKALTPVDHFYIDNHKDLSAEVLAKQIGCTPRTIYNYLAKTKRHSRSNPDETPPVATPAPEPAVPDELKFNPPTPAMSRLGRFKHGTGGALIMTKEASEYADALRETEKGPPTPEYIHRINISR